MSLIKCLDSQPCKHASSRIDKRINELGDWRGKTLYEIRRAIKEADPDVTEELRWRKPTNPMGTPVWSHNGIICTGETYKSVVKLTFAKGASLKDPTGLFNASHNGNTTHAIDIHAGVEVMSYHLRTLFGQQSL